MSSIEDETSSRLSTGNNENTDGNESTELLNNEIRSIKKQFLAVLCATNGVSAIGAVVCWTSSTLPDLASQWNLSEEQESWIGAIPFIGMLFGSILAGYIGDRFGRKSSIIAGNIPLLIGWVVLISAYNTMMIYIGRVLTGFGSVMIFNGATTYVTEISSPTYRGRFGTMALLMHNLGTFIVYVFGLTSWRLMTGIMIILNVIGLITVLPMPESPRWLLIKNRESDALTAMQWFMASSKIDDASLELEKLQFGMKASLQSTFHWKDLSKRGNYLPLIQLLIIHLFRVCFFIQAMSAYASLIFSNISFVDNIYIVPIILESFKCIGLVLSLFFADKIGGKYLLIISGLVMASSMTAFCIYLKFPNIGVAVPITAMLLYFFIFGFGWTPAPWYLIGELLPDHMRSVFSGAIGAYSRVLIFIATKEYFYFEITLSQFGLFLFIAIISLLSSLFVAICIPKSKGKTLDEIRNKYNEGN